MEKALGKMRGIFAAVLEKAKLRKGIVSIAAIFFILQLYFVRELLAAELLFVFAFGVLFTIGTVTYLAGALGERGLAFAEVGIRVVSDAARRGYIGLEEFSRKSFRAPRSESAQ